MTGRFPKVNRRNKKLSGVCAGLAEYFNFNVTLVRIAFLVATFIFYYTFLVYFGLYILMDDQDKKLYKNPQKAKIKGVCAGLADYFEVNSLIVRVLAIISFPVAFWLYIAAIILLDNTPFQRKGRDEVIDGEYERVHPGGGRRRHQREHRGRGNNRQFQSDYSDSRAKEGPPNASQMRTEIRDFDRHFNRVERKLRLLEATITSKKFKLSRELNKMSGS